MEVFTSVVIDTTKNLVNGATITVYLASNDSVATIFERDGVTALANPFLSGYSKSEGEIEFSAANGMYYIKVVNGAETDYIYDVTLLDLSEDVGFGVDTPLATVHIKPPSGDNNNALILDYQSGTPALRLLGAANSVNRIYFGDSVSYRGRIEYSNLDDDLGFYTDGIERINIDSAGAVTITPADALLKVGGSATSTETVGVNIGNARTGDGISFLDLIGDTTYTNYGMRVIRNSTANGNSNIIHRGTGGLQLIAEDAGTVRFQINSSEVARINATGFGIGTASPTFQYGTGLEVSRAADASIKVTRTGATASSAEFVAGNGFSHIGTTLNIPFQFRTNNTERMRIDSAGNVGIGNASPTTAKLVVDGEANTYTARFNGDATTGQSFGQRIRAGTNSSDSALLVENQAGTVQFLNVKGDGAIDIYSGIKFPATQVPSADANTLDDYEEGTWAPVLSDGTNDATMSVQSGTYQKVGRKVSVRGFIRTSSLGSVSGSIRITGLPFATINEANSQCILSAGYGTGLNIAAGQNVSGFTQIADSYINLYLWDSTGGSTAMQHTEWTPDGELIFEVNYYV